MKKENLQLFDDFDTWCRDTGNKPFEYDSIKQFIDGIKNDTLIKCDCCGHYFDEEHSFTARYDFDKLICPDCRADGN